MLAGGASAQLRLGHGGHGRGGCSGGRRVANAGQDRTHGAAELLVPPRVEQRVERRQGAAQEPAGGLHAPGHRQREAAGQAHPHQRLRGQQEDAAEQQHRQAAETPLRASRVQRGRQGLGGRGERGSPRAGRVRGAGEGGGGGGAAGQLVQQVEVEDADPLDADAHAAHDAQVAVQQQRRLRQQRRGRQQRGVVDARGRGAGARRPGREQQHEAQGQRPGQRQHARGVAPLIQCLVGGRRPSDEQVAVQGHEAVGQEGDGEAEAQQPAPQQAVAAPSAVPVPGGLRGAGGQEPEHRLLRHPEGADTEVRGAAVHDEGVAGGLQLSEGRHEIDDHAVGQRAPDGQARVQEGHGNAPARPRLLFLTEQQQRPPSGGGGGRGGGVGHSGQLFTPCWLALASRSAAHPDTRLPGGQRHPFSLLPPTQKAEAE